MIRLYRRALLIAAGTGIAFATITLADSKPSPRDLAVTRITVESTPITRFKREGDEAKTFGKLRFLGGLLLTAPGVRNFGGWSGIVVDPDASGFIAISDSGVWMRGRITYRDGEPSGISDAVIGPLRAFDGEPFRRRRDRDAEAIALESGTSAQGSLIVAFERNSRIARYTAGPSGLSRTRALLQKPAAAREMDPNSGFEAMTVMKGGHFKGRPVALSERLYDNARNHTGWIWVGKHPQTFHLRNIADFDVTDAASLDDGTLFVLERRFRPLEGVKMRIRRIAAGALKPGALLDGDILIEADFNDEIDNMEGLDVTRRPDGSILLTLVSDDNFNHFLQRNLILQFALDAPGNEKTRQRTERQPGLKSGAKG